MNDLKKSILLVIVLSAVFFESTCSPTINNNLIPNLDKIAHFFTFGLIAWLLASISHTRFQIARYKSLSASFLITVFLGGLNEWIQAFTPSRLASVYDVLADMAGAALFLLAWLTLRNRATSESECYICHGEGKYAGIKQ